MRDLGEINPPTPQQNMRLVSAMYFAYSIALGFTGWFGFSLSHKIYHKVAPVWHSYGLLTDGITCGLPLFNSALAITALANFSLFVFTFLKPKAVSLPTFCAASVMSIAILCVYIMVVLLDFYLNVMELLPSISSS